MRARRSTIQEPAIHNKVNKIENKSDMFGSCITSYGGVENKIVKNITLMQQAKFCIAQNKKFCKKGRYNSLLTNLVINTFSHLLYNTLVNSNQSF